jgi:adenosylcobinamide-phosphate synthase
MNLFALLIAWLVEQVRPLQPGNVLSRTQRRWMRWITRNADAGKPAHARIAWGVAAVLPAAVAAGVHLLLMRQLGMGVALLWDALLLYGCIGWRSFNQHFMAIRNALAEGDEPLARQLLARWQGVETARVPATEIARHAIEYAVLSAHRHVYGVIAWGSVTAMFGLGPAGAVFYRDAELAMRYFRLRHEHLALGDQSHLATLAEHAWQVLDWVPARMTALSFAMVGNFVEAVGCWRAHAQAAPTDSDGLVLAAMAGAANLQLGGAVLARHLPQPDELAPGHPRDSLAVWGEDVIITPELSAMPSGSQPRREAEVPRMGEVARLLWRALGVCALLVVLLSLARLL